MTASTNLLYLASIDFPLAKARAIQVVNTCHALALLGCRVTLVVARRDRGAGDDYLPYYSLAPHENLQIVGLPVFRLPSGTPNRVMRLYTRFWNWSYLAGCLALLPSLLREQPRAVLVRDYRLAWLLARLQHWHRRRIVFEVHGLPSAEILDCPQPSLAARQEAARRRKLEDTVFRAAWRLLTITACLRRRLIDDYGVRPERVHTVPDASHAPAAGQTDLASTHGAPRAPVQGRAGGQPRLIYVGQLYPWKGVDLVIRALALVPRAELVLAGGLPDDRNRSALEDLAVGLGVADRVRFAGPRRYRDVPALLADADVALLPLGDGVVARCFTSPLKLFDYLAAGLPIVAVDFPTVREILRHGHNALLAPPGDAAAMAAAINRILDNPTLAAKLGHQARLDAGRYTWEHRARRILAAVELPSVPCPDGAADP